MQRVVLLRLLFSLVSLFSLLPLGLALSGSTGSASFVAVATLSPRTPAVSVGGRSGNVCRYRSNRLTSVSMHSGLVTLSPSGSPLNPLSLQYCSLAFMSVRATWTRSFSIIASMAFSNSSNWELKCLQGEECVNVTLNDNNHSYSSCTCSKVLMFIYIKHAHIV